MDYNKLDELFDRLWPICRSITGPGISKSLEIMRDYIPIKIQEIPTGTNLFDWTVPQEWELERATLKTEDGELVLDTNKSNIHILNFSEPFSGIVSYEELEKHLYSDPKFPEAIPYVTSYYKSRWGLCISDNQKKSLRSDINYIVDIKTKKFDGFLRYGEYFLKGETSETILLTSYLCHPSLANNELSGPLALASIYNKLASLKSRKFSYRFLIIPETIGSISFLAKSASEDLSKIVAGLVLTCLGGPSNTISFKHSRRHWVGDESLIDDMIEKVCTNDKIIYESRNFTPTSGSDERQFCSPAFNLPVVQAARTVYQQYDEYHTSLDNKEFMQISSVLDSVDKILLFLKIYELEKCCLRSTIKGGEPMLSKRYLYPNVNSSMTRKISNDGIFDNREELDLILNVISLVDGSHRLSDITKKLKTSFRKIVPVIEKLIGKGLISYD